MKITNKKNLPDLLVRAVENDPYSPGEKTDISVTTLISPPQMVALGRLHKGEMVEDASERVYGLIGNNAHHILERARGEDDIVEKRFYADVLGWRISGQLDLLEPDGTLNDFKVTSIWAIKAALQEGKDEWLTQLNSLSFLCRCNGLDVKRQRIIAIARDWAWHGKMRDKDYPDHVESIPVEMWSPDKQHGYIEERVRLHQEAREGNYGPCTASERWEKPNSYAVKKKGRKSALRVLDSESNAVDWCVDHGLATRTEGLYTLVANHSIEFRKGESTRCEKYCSVRDYCSQYEQIIGVR